MFTFNHSGKIGDILYSLYFCKAISKKYNFNKFNFNIQPNQIENNPYEESNIRLSKAAAEYIKPILDNQEYIQNVTINENPNMEYMFNLDLFRKLKLNFMAGFTASYYYGLYNNYLERNFDEKILNCKQNTMFKDKLLLFYTTRYQNIFVDIKLLEEFKDKLVFIGLENEYNVFKQNYFNLNFYKVSNMLELAEIISGSKGVISNQNGNFALVELLKANRILINPHYFKINNQIMFGPVTALCHGGKYDYAINNIKLVTLVREFLNE